MATNIKTTVPNIKAILLHPGLWLVIALFIQTLIYGVVQMAKDPGLGWHLASGKWMISHKEILYSDPFLSIQRPWISDQWLSDIIFYQLFSWFGWKGLHVLVISLFSLLVFNYHFIKLRFEAKNFWPTIIGCLFALKAMHVHLIIRPVVFSFPLFALTLWTIRDWEKGRSIPVWFPLIFLIWTNVHPSFVLGLVLLLVGTFSVTLFKRRFQIKDLFLVGFSFLVTVLNPYAIKLHESILFLGQSKFFMNLNLEWRPPTLDSNAGFLIIIIAFLGFLPLVAYPSLRKKVGWFLIITNALFLYATINSIRFLPYFGLIGSIVLSHTLGWIVWRLRRAKLIIKFLIAWAQLCKHAHYIVPRISILTILFLISWTGLVGSIPFQRGNELSPSKSFFPYEAIEYLKEQNDTIVASIPDWGGFIIWFGDGALKPVIDDRNTLLGEQSYRDFLEAFKSLDSLLVWGKSQGADFLLLPKFAEGKKLATVQAIVAYQDDFAVVYKLP